MTTPPRTIYDFGANNGDDIDYYLRKADRVVAVEANPVLAAQVRARFAEAIAAGRLAVENCVLTTQASSPSAPFYVHRTNHVLSQFPAPPAATAAQFERIELPAENVIGLMERHGPAHYVKLDLEHYDHVVLEALFRAGIVPPYISAESHSIEVFALMVALGGYEAFKLVDGRSVPTRYKDHPIATGEAGARHAFPEHSAGPFGEDIAGPWMTRNNFFRLLSFAGLGWKDIHASRIDAPDPAHAPRPQFLVNVRIDF